MIKNVGMLLVCLAVFLSPAVVSAVPVGLITFIADDGVVENGDVVVFTEDMETDQWWYFDDEFIVPENAATLSFDYALFPGVDDEGDYLEFDLNYVPTLFVDGDDSGNFEVDLKGYSGKKISLAWGLVWNGDEAAGTTAMISNIDISTSAQPIPEPATLFLLSSGLSGLVGLRRKKI